MCPSMRKSGVWDFFVEVEFDVWLMTFTIELIHVQVLLEIQRFVCDCPNNQEIMAQRGCYAHVWHFRILHINQLNEPGRSRLKHKTIKINGHGQSHLK